LIDLDSDDKISAFDFISTDNGYIEKGYNVNKNDWDNIKEMTVDYT
jgi:hypothetical protein